MAEPSDSVRAVSDALEVSPEPSRARRIEQDRQQARRTQALTFRLAGFTFEQIGERLGISETAAKNLVNRTLESAENDSVEQLRALENARLDRMQSTIWADALKGDHKAIQLVLKISAERSRLNGTYAPQKIDMSMVIRDEMQQALRQLDEVILEAEVLEDSMERSREDDK